MSFSAIMLAKLWQMSAPSTGRLQGKRPACLAGRLQGKRPACLARGRLQGKKARMSCWEAAGKEGPHALHMGGCRERRPACLARGRLQGKKARMPCAWERVLLRALLWSVCQWPSDLSRVLPLNPLLPFSNFILQSCTPAKWHVNKAFHCSIVYNSKTRTHSGFPLAEAIYSMEHAVIREQWGVFLYIGMQKSPGL